MIVTIVVTKIMTIWQWLLMMSIIILMDVTTKITIVIIMTTKIIIRNVLIRVNRNCQFLLTTSQHNKTLEKSNIDIVIIPNTLLVDRIKNEYFK